MKRIDAKKKFSLFFVFLILLYVWNSTNETLHSLVKTHFQSNEMNERSKIQGPNKDETVNFDDFDEFEDDVAFNNFGLDSGHNTFLVNSFIWEGSMIAVKIAVMAFLFLLGLRIFSVVIGFFTRVQDERNKRNVRNDFDEEDEGRGGGKGEDSEGGDGGGGGDEGEALGGDGGGAIEEAGGGALGGDGAIKGAGGGDIEEAGGSLLDAYLNARRRGRGEGEGGSVEKDGDKGGQMGGRREEGYESDDNDNFTFEDYIHGRQEGAARKKGGSSRVSALGGSGGLDGLGGFGNEIKEFFDVSYSTRYDNLVFSDLIEIISMFAFSPRNGVLWIICSSCFILLYVYFVVPNGEDGNTRHLIDEESTHMHIDIVMFFLLFINICLLFYAAVIN